MMSRIEFGIDRFLRDRPAQMAGANFGILLNHASRTADWRLSCDAIAARYPGQLTTLMSPQHGLWGVEQANMIESQHGWYEPLKLPVYSLYSRTRRPTTEMLEKVDVLLIDLQDVGTRVYTFAWSILECLYAAVEHHVRVVVLDRPNPLGGHIVEGPILDRDYTSFVGGWTIPLRHGLTIGELASLLASELQIDVDLEIIPMRGWNRRMIWPDTHCPWIWPSPNLPHWTSCLMYPGIVLFEGTNLSEGRGTTRPFQITGAPWIDGDQWLKALPAEVLEGLQGLPTRFKPTFDKWRGDVCGGIDWYPIGPDRIRSVGLAVALILAANQLDEEHFAWLDPPYEYEYQKRPIDILFGSDRLRRAVDSGMPPTMETVDHLVRMDQRSWWERCEPVLLYS